MTVGGTIKYLAIAGLLAMIVIVLAFWFNVLVVQRVNVPDGYCSGMLSGLDPDCESPAPS